MRSKKMRQGFIWLIASTILIICLLIVRTTMSFSIITFNYDLSFFSLFIQCCLINCLSAQKLESVFYEQYLFVYRFSTYSRRSWNTLHRICTNIFEIFHEDPNQDLSWKWHTHVYTHSHTHTYIYICMCVCIDIHLFALFVRVFVINVSFFYWILFRNMFCILILWQKKMWTIIFPEEISYLFSKLFVVRALI